MGDSLDVCSCWLDRGNLAFCPSCFLVIPCPARPCKEDVSPAWRSPADPILPVQHSAASQRGFSPLLSLPASAEGCWELGASPTSHTQGAISPGRAGPSTGGMSRASAGPVLWHVLLAVGCCSSSRSRNPIPCGCLLLAQGLVDACSSWSSAEASPAAWGCLSWLGLPMGDGHCPLLWPEGLRLLFSLALAREEEAEGLWR